MNAMSWTVKLFLFASFVKVVYGILIPQYLRGHTLKIQDQAFVRLTCTMSKPPIGNTVEFIKNGKTQEQLTSNESYCYRSNGQICDKDCTCDKSGRVFELFLRSSEHDEFEVLFECKARYRDERSNDMFLIYSTIAFNGSGFRDNTYHSERINSDDLKKAINSTSWMKSGGIILTIGVIVLVAMLFSFALGYKIYRTNKVERAKSKNKRKDSPEAESTPLLEQTQRHGEECCSCYVLTACAFCAECEGFYCKICCDAHRDEIKTHKIYQTEHIKSNDILENCSTCKSKKSTRVCSICKIMLCKSCICDHRPSEYITLRTQPNQKLDVRETQSNTDINRLTRKNTIQISKNLDNTRPCGLAVLNDSRIVSADQYEKSLKVFSFDGNIIFTHNFKNEPRGMTGMFDDLIAVTFAYQMEIIILNIKSKALESSTITTANYGKPFSICYNADRFAVEIGEGQDGMIAIFSKDGEFIHAIKVKKFAYFTGNTIRLSMESVKGRIYVSDMGKTKVTCVDFDGKIKWSTAIPSPRGICVANLQNLLSLQNKTILIASKNGNSIYRLHADSGQRELWMTNVKEPRYILYSTSYNLLFILVEGGEVNIYNCDTSVFN